jgi:hypothetical protein
MHSIASVLLACARMPEGESKDEERPENLVQLLRACSIHGFLRIREVIPVSHLRQIELIVFTGI